MPLTNGSRSASFKQGMILGCLPEWGGSIRSLEQTGQHGRLFSYYFPQYLRRFEKIYHFSYNNESIDEFTGPELHRKVQCLGNRGPFGRRAYTLALAIQQREWIKACSALRVFQASGVLPAVQAKILYKIPFITTYGYRYANMAKETGAQPWKAAVFAWLERLALHFSDGVIVTTRELENHVRSAGTRCPVYYIPNGVDTSHFCSSGNGRLTGPVIKIAFVGRLEVGKDLPTLFEAAKLLKQEGVDCQVQLIGGGTLRNALARRAADLGIRVDFPGVIPHEKLPEILAGADLFVLPSIREGHPKALIEAMSCGLPSIVSDCDGNRTLVAQEETGLLFPVRDARALAEAVKRVAGQPELALRLGQNARRCVVENFDIRELLYRETELLAGLAKG